MKIKKKCEQEIDTLKKNVQDVELALRKAESEKQSKENQIRSLQDEIANQDEHAGKLNKEKKHQEEVNKKLTEDLQAQEDKYNHLNKVKAKLEGQLDEVRLVCSLSKNLPKVIQTQFLDWRQLGAWKTQQTRCGKG